jgi:DNA-binding transcriptional MocR family regulator
MTDVRLDEAIYFDATLSLAARIVYGAITSYDWNGNGAWPSQARIASRLGISRHTVLRAIAELEAAGLLAIEHRPGRPSLYRALNPTCAREAPVPESHRRQDGIGGVPGLVYEQAKENERAFSLARPLSELTMASALSAADPARETGAKSAPVPKSHTLGNRTVARYAEGRKARGLEPLDQAKRNLGQLAKKPGQDEDEMMRLADWMAACEMTNARDALAKMRDGQQPPKPTRKARDLDAGVQSILDRLGPS